MATLKTLLTQLGKEWKKAESVEMGMGAQLPEGNYEGFLTGGEIELSKASERLQLVWDLKAVSPSKYEGTKVKKFDSLDNEISMGWTKGLLELLGITVPDKLSELPGILAKFFKKNGDVPISFRVKQNEEFMNIYINSVLAGSDLEGAKETEEEVEEEEEEEEEVEEEETDDIDEIISMLDDMNLKEVLEFADEYDIKVPKAMSKKLPIAKKFVIKQIKKLM